MNVEKPPSVFSYTDEDQNNLKQLLEVFGSVVSLEDIASAYCKTGRDLFSTADMLQSMPVSSSGSSGSKSPIDLETTIDASSRSSSDTMLENAHNVKVKSKKCSASAGSISNVIGRNYTRSKPQLNGQNEKLKPVKLNSDDFPDFAIWGEKKELASGYPRGPMDKDIGEFVYKMLGEYQMDKSVIQDVIGQCGYDMPTSMDKLLDLAAVTLEKSDDVIGIAAKNTTENSLDVRSTSSQKQTPVVQNSGSEDELRISQTKMRKNDIEREVLEALFTARDREEPTVPIRKLKSPIARMVAQPIQETVVEDFTFITRKTVSKPNTNQESYEELRKAVQENWVTVQEYLKAAVEAFKKDDEENTRNLIEEFHFYMRRAREADKKSAAMLVKGSEEEEEICINVHYLDSKEALNHVKPVSLKVVVGKKGDKKDTRRKNRITKLLEDEGISWTEEGDGWTICIPVETIDPKKLSFVNE